MILDVNWISIVSRAPQSDKDKFKSKNSETGIGATDLHKKQKEILKKTLLAACQEGYLKLPTQNYYAGRGYSPRFSFKDIAASINIKPGKAEQIEKRLKAASAYPALAIEKGNEIANIIESTTGLDSYIPYMLAAVFTVATAWLFSNFQNIEK
jgi:hypothetical protein